MALGLAISAVSAAALGYEILLMRLFSIIQWHQFAYMIISLALLGIGASGTVLTLAREWLEPRFAAAFPISAALFGAAAVASFALAQRVPFNPLELAWDARQFAYLVGIYLLLAVPFVFAGGCVGIALAWFKDRVGLIYSYDLVGAGCGALGVVAVMFVLPPADCLRLVGALGFAAAALACLDRAVQGRRTTAAALAACGVVVALATPAEWLEPRLSPYKGLSLALTVPGAVVVETRSSPLGLLTAVRSPLVPFRHAPGLSLRNTVEPPEQIGVFTDGDAMTAITRYDGDRAALAYLDYQTSALPYHLLARPSVLVLGAGGGADVLLALTNEARAVDAVDLNPQMIGLVQRDFADFAGAIYGRDDVRVHVADARAFVAEGGARYDLVFISLLESFAASAAGVHALSKSTLYTVEAFGDYLARLAPGGLLAVTRWLKLPPRDTIKLFATAVAALERAGVARPERRLAMIRGWGTATLLVKNGALSAGDIANIRAFTAARGFDVAYYPGMRRAEANRNNVLAEPYLFDAATALLGEKPEVFLRDYKFHVAPATDDRPYFFRFFKWGALPELLELRGRGGNALIEWGYLIVVATLAQAALASVLLIVLPLLRLRRGGAGGSAGLGEGPRVVVYFFALGLAFLFIEIAFIERFTLFLGHPLYAAAVVLSGFLLFAGLGSGASARLGRRFDGAAVAVAVAAIAVVALLYIAALPPLFAALRPLWDAAKIALSIALIAPLAFAMGMPFPLGLARLAERAPGWIPWAWAINGSASVVSAVLAILLTIHLGFSAVVAIAVALYVVAALAFGARARPAAP